MAVKQSEEAVLSVSGGTFKDWESVWVQHTWGDAYSLFKFTCAERDDQAAHFIPGDECEISLAGEIAIEGYILNRQVAYDAYHHGVQISGANKTFYASHSSIDSKTSSYDGKDFLTIAKEVLSKTDVPEFETKGNIDKTPFKYAHNAPGEPIFHFLERYGRLRKIIVTCTKEGKFLFVGQGKNGGSQGELIEGQNILKMQCVISEAQQRSKYYVRNQINGSDAKNMENAARMQAIADGRLKKHYCIKIIPAEQGMYDNKELQTRCDTESMWTEAQQIQATIVVQGWQPGGSSSRGGSGGPLWTAGKDVKVKSPSALIDQDLSIQQVTYTQDNNHGSLTTLICVAPWGLNGSTKYQPKDAPAPKPSSSTPTQS